MILENNHHLAARKAEIFKALAHPLRVLIFESLQSGEKSVTELTRSLSEKEPVISKHISIMKRAGILKTRKEGTKVYYSIKFECLKGIFPCINTALIQMADNEMKIKSLLTKNER